MPLHSIDNQSNFDNRSLLEKVAEGDQKAFEELYETCLAPIYRYCYARLGRKEAAEDITQIVFAKAWQARRQYEHRNRPPLAYLFTIARNAIVDHIRRKEPIPVFNAEQLLLTLPDDTQTPARIAEQREAIEYTDKALRGLDSDQCETILLRYIADLPYAEIAIIMGKSEENVRQIVSRALKAMRKATHLL